jgi:flagellar protein FliS
METASDQYLRNAVMTASPEQLQLMLYDGAIRFTRHGIEGLEKQNFEDVFYGFGRAQKIVLELLGSLNYDVDRALCTRMAGLYNYIYRQLVEANVQRNVRLAREALELLEYQRETWVLLMNKLVQERSGGAPEQKPAPSRPPAPSDEVYGSLSVQG